MDMQIFNMGQNKGCKPLNFCKCLKIIYLGIRKQRVAFAVTFTTVENTPEISPTILAATTKTAVNSPSSHATEQSDEFLSRKTFRV